MQMLGVTERDDALMACLAARDAQALRTVISLYGDKAHRIAWRMLGDAGEAEDVALEAMLKLWQQAGVDAGGRASARGWRASPPLVHRPDGPHSPLTRRRAARAD